MCDESEELGSEIPEIASMKNYLNQIFEPLQVNIEKGAEESSLSNLDFDDIRLLKFLSSEGDGDNFATAACQLESRLSLYYHSELPGFDANNDQILLDNICNIRSDIAKVVESHPLLPEAFLNDSNMQSHIKEVSDEERYMAIELVELESYLLANPN